MANYRHIMAVVSIGLFGCDTDVSLTTSTTSSALKTDAQLNELEGDLRAPGSMCVADASEQNVEYGATANPLALDVPFSSNICRLLAPAGIASPGQIGTVTSMSAGGNGDLDATCQAAMDAS